MAQELIESLKTSSQTPLDEKIYFQTLAEVKDLGNNNNKAFSYYEDMVISCVETHKEYIWREEAIVGEIGILDNSFTYPSGAIVGNIDYSNRTFNFYLNQAFTDTQIDRLKDSVYEELVQTLSVLPTTFEKGVPTDLVYTWNVNRKDDTLTSTTLDGVDKTSEATGVNRTYTIEDQVSTKSTSLISQVVRNNLSGGTDTETTTRTSTALIPQYYGKLPAGGTPDLTYTALQNHTKFLSSSSAKTITLSYSNEILFILSTNSNATILDVNGFNVTDAFTKSTVIMQLEQATQSITQYLLNNPLNSTGTYQIN